MSFSDSLFSQLVSHDVDLLRFDAATRRRIRAVLIQLQDELVIALGGVDFSNVARESRLQALLDQVDKILATNYRGMRTILARDMRDLAALEQTFAVDGMNKLFKVDIMSAALTPEKLRALARNADILGAPAREWWSRQGGRMQRAFQDNMRQGFLLGESTGDLVRRVRGTSTGKRQIIELANGSTKSVHVFEGGIMQVSTREAEALVRTAVQSVANQVRLETYRANKDVIKTLQAQVTLDSATSSICQSHGSIPDEWDIETLEPIGGSNTWTGPPPWHFNCRSSLLPITKSWEELQQQGRTGTRKQRRIARTLDNNAPKRLRASMDGQVPRGISFDKWLKRQPKSIQLDLLGPTKRRLWLKGKLSLSQMLDQTGRPLSLAQILKKLGLGG